MKDPAEILIPKTGTFTQSQFQTIQSYADKNKWSIAQTIGIMCAAGMIELERRAKEAAAIAAGGTQVDAGYFKAGA